MYATRPKGGMRICKFAAFRAVRSPRKKIPYYASTRSFSNRKQFLGLLYVKLRLQMFVKNSKNWLFHVIFQSGAN